MYLTREKLYEDSIKSFNSKLSSTGALVVYSGDKCGRCPKDKRVVYNDKTKDIWWGNTTNNNVNIKISHELYSIYLDYAIFCSQNTYSTYIVDAYAGHDLNNQLKIRIYCYNPYHALFMKNMLIPSPQPFEIDDIDFTIYNVGHMKLYNVDVPENIRDITLKETLIALHFTDNSIKDNNVTDNSIKGNMVIYGTEYAGEMKKGILTLMMYEMYRRNHLPLHSSANMGINDDNITLFFGLSGTGKTTLSADPKRYLIGDDEHVWTDNGIFNIEGGCYAKCINLDCNKEPDIFKAIKYGTVLENVTMDMDRVVDYDDISITENTRASYPLNYIDNAIIPAIASHPTNIIFLTCDASGLLPPVAKLNNDQAVFMFICGYTSKICGTEVGITEPTPVFSSCFGEPFLIWSPKQYGELLENKLKEHPKINVWMINTGWIEGEYGKGKRISIKYTRSIIDAIHDNNNSIGDYVEFPFFKFQIPKYCKNVPSNILNPQDLWPDGTYMPKLANLHNKFIINYNNKCNISSQF